MDAMKQVARSQDISAKVATLYQKRTKVAHQHHRPVRAGEAIASLPKLLSKRGDRERLITLVRRLLAGERMRRFEPTTEQLTMLANIGETLDVEPAKGWVRAPARKPTRKPAAKARKGR